ncbi:MAG TPA: hypothetical protein VL463_20695 [Kofleriaceae bacterium]|nr:hypothetical protein [Kofleriaceae bacterium]
MALLRFAIASALLAGCYDPRLKDCTVTCHGAGDCASGQVCGNDGFCAAPGVAGTCATRPDAKDAIDASEIDAPIGVIDARFDARVDARTDASPPDAAGAQLHITITNKGKVVDSGNIYNCQNPPGDCLFGAEPGQVVTLTAVQTINMHPFDKWTDSNCAGQGATCTFTITAPVTTIAVTFK